MNQVMGQEAGVALSLIICTRNRAASLRRCLDALDTQELADVSGEVVLVDNGSTDNTTEVMEAFAEKAQCPVRFLSEEKPGLGRARNTGVTTASGNVLVFTDDDCYLTPGYIREASTIFDQETFRYCGGRILLHDPTDAPCGLNRTEHFQRIPPYSFVRAGKIKGANMIIHRQVFETIGLFDPQLGAGMPFRFEDIDLIGRASLGGFAGAHIPQLIVYHHHGRKPGLDVKKLAAQNDLARGAYYAKLALMGEFQFLEFWVSEMWKRQRRNQKNPRASLGMLSKTAREMRGTLRYLGNRAINVAKRGIPAS